MRALTQRGDWMGAVLAAWALWFPAAALTAERPDFSGVWQISGAVRTLKTEDGKVPPLKPAAARLYEERQRKLAAGDLSFDPTAQCISPGLPRILYLPYPFQLVQGAERLVYLFEWNYWNRRVYLDGQRREAPYPLALGVSHGSWDGEALVIDTTGFRADNTILDAAGMPHSEALHVVERLRLLDAGRVMEDRITIDDPETFTKAWTTVARFQRLPAQTRIKEDVCLDRIDAGRPAVEWPAAR